MICEKCGNSFPVNIKIDGKWKNLNKRKYCLDCSPYGQHNTAQIKNYVDGEKLCKRCGTNKKYDEFYIRRGNGLELTSYCIECSKKQSKERSDVKKQKCIDYLGGKCQNPKCGYNKCNAAFDFHHRDRLTKKFEISAKLKSYSFERLKPELDKCVLVCCRCHREIEAGILKIQ